MPTIHLTTTEARRHGLLAKRIGKKSVAKAHCMFPALCEAAGLPRPVPEWKFHGTRKWAFDWAFVNEKVAIEIEGGAHVYGRHHRPKGYANDCEKYNEATILGWRLIRVSPQQFASGAALELVRRALA
jgi:hypothetical protein